MWPFKCNHPMYLLAVEKKETVKVIDREFEEVTYYFSCFCGKKVEKGYSRLRISVEDFLRNK